MSRITAIRPAALPAALPPDAPHTPAPSPVERPAVPESGDTTGALRRAAARFHATPAAAPSAEVKTLRRRFREYIDAIPYDAPGNLKKTFPGLYHSLKTDPDLSLHPLRIGVIEKSEAIHRHIFYLGDPNASRVIVSLTGTPITAGYLVPFFKLVARELNDPETAFLLLPSCSDLEAQLVLSYLRRHNRLIRSFGFFTHSGGSRTLHQLQKDGHLPENTRSFVGLGWVYRHDFQTFDPASYQRNDVPIPPFTKPQSRGGDWYATVKRAITSIGHYYFPDFAWNHRPTRDALLGTFVDGAYLRRVSSGMSELGDWQNERGGYARQVTELARMPEMRFLIFAGTDDDIVSEKHSREALARLAGIPLRDIPRDESWSNGHLSWHPIVGGKHLPMFEHAREMAKTYADFLRAEKKAGSD